MKVLAYQKQSDDQAVLNDILKSLKDKGYDTCTIYMDSDRDFIAYREMKTEITDTNVLLFVSSLRDLAHTRQQVLDELEWYKNCDRNLVIAEYPTMLLYMTGATNHAALSMLIDMCRSMMDDKIFEIRDAEKIEMVVEESWHFQIIGRNCTQNGWRRVSQLLNSWKSLD